MPAISGRRRHRALAAVLCCALPAASSAAAQDAAYFSPTFAASHGSPYSEIYARTFGAPPLETAAPAPADAPAPSVVYVIENDRLLTYSATDFARGGAQALAGAALPTAPAGGRLYGAIPPAPADSGDAVPLLPQN